MPIIHPAKHILEYLEAYDSGFEPGMSTGWECLDDKFTIRRGELTIITGSPSHGKSEWLDAMLVQAAKLHNMHTIMYSPENYPPQMHISKLAEKWVGKPFMLNNPHRMSMDESMDALYAIDKYFRFMEPSRGSYTINELLNEAAGALGMMVETKFSLVIDPWNDIELNRIDGVPDSETIGHALRDCRNFAREFNVPLFIVAHPTKLLKDKEGNYPVATPYDIAGSANWFNKADNCITVWRDTANAPTDVDIHVQKVRNRATGYPGIGRLRFNLTTRRYD